MKLFIGIFLLLWSGIAIRRRWKGADTFFDWQVMSTWKIDPKNPITFYIDLITLLAMIGGGIFAVIDFLK
ncbi:MAG TPA: hypothetical protein VJ111_13980 [Chitinophagaceae bacterium]|nr:hypothetical protein [Chitinophagaceae bacterium]